MKGNEKIYNAIIEAVDSYYDENLRTPSIRKIGEMLNISKSAVQRYLVEMNELGLLSYTDRRIETQAMRSYYDMGSEAAFFDVTVHCGALGEIPESEIDYVRLPERIFGRGDFFILRAKGDSMTDEGIDDGDYVVFKKNCLASPGDIILALDENGENTLKKYAGYDNERQKFVLSYCNAGVYKDKTIEISELRVQGVLEFVIRKK